MSFVTLPILALLVVLNNFPAQAQTQPQAQAQRERDLVDAYNRMMQMKQAGQYEEAKSHAVRMLVLSMALYSADNPNIDTSLDYATDLYFKLNSPADAHTLFVRVLQYRQDALPADHIALGRSYHSIAAFYANRQDYDAAELYFERALAITEKALGPEHKDVADALNNVAGASAVQGKYEKAERLLKRVLAIREKVLGPDSVEVGRALSNLAYLYTQMHRYADAEPLFMRAFTLAETTLEPLSDDFEAWITKIGLFYRDQNRSADFEDFCKRLLYFADRKIDPDRRGLNSVDVGRALESLATRYSKVGCHAAAGPLYLRALAIGESALDPQGADFQKWFRDVEEHYRIQGGSLDLEALYQRALALAENTLGPNHAYVVMWLGKLANFYSAEGRYSDAEPLHKRSVAITEKVVGLDHPDLVIALGFLASFYEQQGRWVDAEPVYRRMLAITEQGVGPNDPRLGTTLSRLAVLYGRQGRKQDAESLYKRTLAIYESAYGQIHQDVADALNNLAMSYHGRGQDRDAEPLLRRALAIRETFVRQNDPELGLLLDNLGIVLEILGRDTEAETHYKRALSITENSLGPNHPKVAATLNNRGLLYSGQRRFAEAEPLFVRAIAIYDRTLGPNSLESATAADNLAFLYLGTQDWRKAAGLFRRSADVVIRRTVQGEASGRGVGGKSKSEAEQMSWQFRGLVKTTYLELKVRNEKNNSKLADEMFEYAQWAQSSESAKSLAQMAGRRAKDNDQLAQLIRARQDLIKVWQDKDEQLRLAMELSPGQRDEKAVSILNANLTEIDIRISDTAATLAAEFPDYAALASPQPLAVEQVQTDLRPDEALVLFLDTLETTPTPEETFVWVVTKSDVRWVRSDLGTSALSREVAALRCGLDRAAWLGDGMQRCAELLKNPSANAPAVGEPLPFDHARAHALYKGLFGEVEDLIKGKHLLIVPSGALTQIPFQVLVTEPPKSGDNRAIAWMARDHAITVLPAVSSLKALRRVGKPSAGPHPFIGFGNPLLDGDPNLASDIQRAKLARDMQHQGCPELPRPRLAASNAQHSGIAPVAMRGGLADLAHLKVQLPLPETADELCAVARDLQADAREIRLGARATEREIKTLSASGALARYRIVHFATHGTLAGQLTGTTEPGLILTPPDKATEEDDGYLSASEIAALKLDADWVILSACNTAGGAGKGEAAEALSGLARAFFYAQARALLVSHWAVDSATTVQLVTTAVGELAADPKIGRGEALRLAMIWMIDRGRPHEAHPAYWAPFVVVGEGGAGR